jgi:hypothetical protein
VLALVRVRSAGFPARESVAACRGRSCRCGPAADRTPALQRGMTSLHCASWLGHAAVVQTLLQHGADVAARDAVGAAGVPQALAWRSARECLHAMCVRAMVCMEMCVRNRARLCCCAEAAACGEVEQGMEMGRTCMHALATHPLTPLPASGRGNSPRLCQERRDQDSAARARGQAFALLCGSEGHGRAGGGSDQGGR